MSIAMYIAIAVIVYSYVATANTIATITSYIAMAIAISMTLL